MKTVYLSGPISGLTLAQARSWRDVAIDQLDSVGIRGVDPTRCENALKSIGEISAHGRDYADLNPLSRPRAVLVRDHRDAVSCDVLLANFLDATKASLGTAMEIAWAYHLHIPIVVALRQDDPWHDHMMITGAALHVTHDLDDALDVTVALCR